MNVLILCILSIVIFQCEGCVPNSVQLAHVNASYGLLEMCLTTGQWYPVCASEDLWTDALAMLACEELGLPYMEAGAFTTAGQARDHIGINDCDGTESTIGKCKIAFRQGQCDATTVGVVCALMCNETQCNSSSCYPPLSTCYCPTFLHNVTYPSDMQCQNGGTCDSGRCICAEGWSGDQCTVPSATTPPATTPPATTPPDTTPATTSAPTIPAATTSATQASLFSTPSVPELVAKDSRLVVILTAVVVILVLLVIALLVVILLVYCFLQRRRKMAKQEALKQGQNTVEPNGDAVNMPASNSSCDQLFHNSVQSQGEDSGDGKMSLSTDHSGKSSNHAQEEMFGRDSQLNTLTMDINWNDALNTSGGVEIVETNA